MTTTVKALRALSGGGQIISLPHTTLQSNISYEMVPMEQGGLIVPTQIGEGRYAKVYRASQRSAGRHIRPVAIKVLHDNADRGDERLFRMEIDLLKELTTVTGVNVVKTLDIIHMAPMVMCGCGVIYHPRCPRGCDVPLQRRDPPGEEHPALHCVKCGAFELSGKDIQQRFLELLKPPAKTCCQSGPTAQKGTIISFVDRMAVVMEYLDCKMTDFADQRRDAVELLRSQHGLGQISAISQSLDGRRVGRGRAGQDELLQKVILLEKLFLMVQLAEAVAWLHGDKRIVHKDLAPDNVMVRMSSEEAGEGGWRGEANMSLSERLQDMASYPRFRLRLIDFGLADKDELSRVWYEDQDVTTAVIKLPYLSPEARLRKQRVSDRIEFQPAEARFRIPPDLMSSLSVMPGDILADISDAAHDHDLEITEVVEDPPKSGIYYARYKGEPPSVPLNHAFELVRRLGEAHDIYAVGALFYYILTRSNEEVNRLGALVTSLLDKPCELTPEALRRRDIYDVRRDALPEKFWQDELMVLVLRAMVRGQPQSFMKDRIQRGAEPAQRLLRATKRIYFGLQQEILSAPKVWKMKRAAAVLAAMALGAGVWGGYWLGRQGAAPTLNAGR